METNTNTENHTESTAAPVARYAELQALVASMAADFQKFYQDGNKAAGTRVRNAMQELKTLAQAIRTEVQAIKNEGGGGKAEGGESDSEAS
jgi:flagellar biosynthesis/type III secretory pathway protein FliH